MSPQQMPATCPLGMMRKTRMQMISWRRCSRMMPTYDRVGSSLGSGLGSCVLEVGRPRVCSSFFIIYIRGIQYSSHQFFSLGVNATRTSCSALARASNHQFFSLGVNATRTSCSALARASKWLAFTSIRSRSATVSEWLLFAASSCIKEFRLLSSLGGGGKSAPMLALFVSLLAHLSLQIQDPQFQRVVGVFRLSGKMFQLEILCVDFALKFVRQRRLLL
eukprot:SAG31_NODE_628_length_13432_cov_131.456086_10_plen_220_part_00